MTSQLSQPKREQKPDALDRDDRPWFQRRLGWIALLLVLIGAGLFMNMKQSKVQADTNDKGKLVVSGRIESDESHIGARLPSQVSAVYVKEGETVHKGQLLIALDSSDLAARVRAADAGVSLAEDQERIARAQLSAAQNASRMAHSQSSALSRNMRLGRRRMSELQNEMKASNKKMARLMKRAQENKLAMANAQKKLLKASYTRTTPRVTQSAATIPSYSSIKMSTGNPQAELLGFQKQGQMLQAEMEMMQKQGQVLQAQIAMLEQGGQKMQVGLCQLKKKAELEQSMHGFSKLFMSRHKKAELRAAIQAQCQAEAQATACQNEAKIKALAASEGLPSSQTLTPASEQSLSSAGAGASASQAAGMSATASMGSPGAMASMQGGAASMGGAPSMPGSMAGMNSMSMPGMGSQDQLMAQLMKSQSQPMGMMQGAGQAQQLELMQMQGAMKAQQAGDMVNIARIQVDAAHAAVRKARAERDALKANGSYFNITSPIDGIIATRSVQPGDMVAPGQILMTIMDPKSVYLRGFIPEGNIGKVTIGERALVYLDSDPGRAFNARVASVDSQAAFTPENVYFKQDRVREAFGVKLAIDNPNGFAKPGMPADAEIVLPNSEPTSVRKQR